MNINFEIIFDLS